jgi:hypothetical protein
LAVSYAGELARWGIETTIVVPGAFTKGTNHFPDAGHPADKARQAEYDDKPYERLPAVILESRSSLEPPDADVGTVAEDIVTVVNAPFGKRPFCIHIDPSRDGCEEVNGVADRMRTELLRRIGLTDLLRVKQ